jgi:hypothetical protein
VSSGEEERFSNVGWKDFGGRQRCRPLDGDSDPYSGKLAMVAAAAQHIFQYD